MQIKKEWLQENNISEEFNKWFENQYERLRKTDSLGNFVLYLSNLLIYALEEKYPPEKVEELKKIYRLDVIEGYHHKKEFVLQTLKDIPRLVFEINGTPEKDTFFKILEIVKSLK